MKETTSVAMPPCLEKFCQKLDSAFKTKAQKRELRHYLAGLLGESERKNITQIANNNLAITYHKLHHCLDAVAHGGNPQDRAAPLYD